MTVLTMLMTLMATPDGELSRQCPTLYRLS